MHVEEQKFQAGRFLQNLYIFFSFLLQDWVQADGE
jgi:hypothetical protein